MTNEKILILDFGSQYTQLIARRIREQNIYCEIHPYNNIPNNLSNLKGVILSGSPFSVRDDNAPIPNLEMIIGTNLEVAVRFRKSVAGRVILHV